MYIFLCFLRGDKRETAKNIGLACNLIDPDMENIDLVGSLSIEDMNRVIEITGDWANMTSNHDSLRVLFDTLDCAGDLDGHRTGYISREELRYYLIGLRVPQIDDDRIFDAQWAMVASSRDGRVSEQQILRSTLRVRSLFDVSHPLLFTFFFRSLSPNSLVS